MTINSRLPKHIFLFALLLSSVTATAQFRNQQPDWKLLSSPGRLVQADAALESNDGWTHFYQEQTNTLLLSIKTFGQDIGSVQEDLKITSGLLAGFGRSANDLSGASYVDQSIWLTMNRYWRIEKANPIREEVRVRFYYSKADYNDLLNGLEDVGLEQKQTGELLFYVLTGGSVHPFTNRPEAARARFQPLRDTLDTQPVAWASDFYYVEFNLNTLQASGSGGFLIPMTVSTSTVSGRILQPNGQPLEGAEFPSIIGGASVRTDEQGYYALANLPVGEQVRLNPQLNDFPLASLTVLDMVALEKRLNSGEPFEDPYRELAADIDRSGKVDQLDLDYLQDLILGRLSLNSSDVWRFVPASFTFQLDANPLFPTPPSTIEVGNIYTDRSEQDFVAVKLGNVADESDFPNDPPVLLDAGFSLPEVQTCGADELISLGLTVSGFDDVMGFQFTLKWDPRVLAYSETDQFNLPGFSSECFSIDSIGYGILQVAWFTSETSRATRLPDGTNICRLRFRAIGEDQSETKINFFESPVPIQVLRKNLSPSNVLFTAGVVNIKWETGIGSFSADIHDVSCFSNQDGAIDLTVKGSHGPYRYEWSNGETTEDIDSLLPGAYYVTITGNAKCPLISDSLVVHEPRVLFIHNENVRQIQCPGGTDGAVSFKTSGGSPPYIYKWSNGYATPWIGNLGAGTYKVTIQDQNGCRAMQEFVIDPAPPLHINYSISPAGGPFESNGSITIHDLLGSTPPQEFLWSNGASGPITRGLSPGEYEVSVSDAARCQYLLKFEVPDIPAPANLRADLRASALPADSAELLIIESPDDQTIQIKVFDSGSQQVWQKIVPLCRGHNYMYFLTPSEPGSYLLQLVPRTGRVNSQRFTIK